MATQEKSQYEKDEDVLIDCINGLMEFYNMDLKEVIAVIKDRLI
jgi:hypothetical protein